MVRRSLGLPTQPLAIGGQPAVGRVTVSSPAVIKPLANLNDGKAYPDQIKPFNFLLTCHVSPLGHPKGADPQQFHLIAPYNSNAGHWLRMDWIDQYTGNSYRISTTCEGGTTRSDRVKTYGDVLREFEHHPESKCADASGKPCGKQSIGLLQRRHIQIDHVRFIDKESNQLEAVAAGLIHCETGAYTEYVDRRRDEWAINILPALKAMSLSKLIRNSGLSRRALLDIRAGRSRPHSKNHACLRAIARKLFSAQLPGVF